MGSLSTNSHRKAAACVWIAAAVLFVLHQDFWLWDNGWLLFGFMPVGLAYHALYSVLAGALWVLAVRYAWPDGIEAWIEERDATRESSGDE